MRLYGAEYNNIVVFCSIKPHIEVFESLEIL
jgi:hypothetical protein